MWKHREDRVAVEIGGDLTIVSSVIIAVVTLEFSSFVHLPSKS